VIPVTPSIPNRHTPATIRIADACHDPARPIATPTTLNTRIAKTRHTHASALLLAGTPEWVVSRRLGHAHVQTTIDLYGWVREDEALRAAANWASFTSSWQVRS
jgi:integrase